MAEVNHFYAEGNTAQTETGTTFVDVDTTDGRILGSSLASSTKYLVIARALIGVNDATDRGGFRLNVIDNITVRNKSSTTVEFQQTGATELKSWLFVHSYTTAVTPQNVSFQFRMVDSGSTITCDQYSLLLIDLDDLGSGNYFEDIGTETGTELPLVGAKATLATIAGSSLGTTEEWLSLGYAKIGVGSAGVNYNVALNGADDSASASDLNIVDEEGEDTAEERMCGLVGRHKAVTSNVDLDIQAWEDANNGNHTDQGSYLIAIKGSAFADFEHDYNANGRGYSSGEEATEVSVGPYTPSVSGNHLIIGRSNIEAGGSNAPKFGLWLEDGTTETRTGDSSVTHDQGWDNAKDEEPAFTMQRISISAEKTYNLQGKNNATGMSTDHSWLLVLNLNKAPVPGVVYPPFPRRKQTTVRM